MHTALSILYFAVIGLLSVYGVHRLYLVALCALHRRRLERIASTPIASAGDAATLPRVTIQLPLFNESTVVDRLLDAVALVDYPRDLLEIQVLDDSIDETTTLARAGVTRLCEGGIDAVYIHRTDRVGYKAGALANGLRVAKGELIAIFDADFVPQPGFVRALLPHFDDPTIAMVQTRWGYMNREMSILTRVQALQLDGHHLVENRARFGAGLLFNFSGTGGMWRRTAIDDAGGWQHDTLTEDLDLSYRAQLKGWRFIYRPDVVTPSELPEDVSAVRAQQYRWAKGTVQTARKLLGRVLSADLPHAQRIEAFFHMTPHFACPLMVAMSVLLLPALAMTSGGNNAEMFLIDVPLLMATTGSLAAFYMEAERAQGRSRGNAILRLPWMIALGTGLAPHMSRAVFDGMRAMAGEFVRTPKQGDNKARYKARADLPIAESALAVVSFLSVLAAVHTDNWFAAPFAFLFMLGYGYVAFLVAAEQLERKRGAAEPDRTSDPVAAPSMTEIGAHG